MTFPMVFAEVTGERRAILLKGRSLPYQGMIWQTEQRVNLAWFPGNPTAVAQVLGPTFAPTTFTGMWKDRYLGDPGDLVNTDFPSAGKLFGFPPIAAEALLSGRTGGSTFTSAVAAPTATGANATRSRVLRDAFESLARAGQLIKVEWGSIARFGFLTRAAFPHDREEDIKFELEFSWIGDTDAQPEFLERPEVDPTGKLGALLQALAALINKFLAALVKAQLFLQQFTQAMRKISSLVGALFDIFNKMAEIVSFPADLLQEARGILTRLRLELGDLKRRFDNIPAAYNDGFDPIEKNQAQAIQQALRLAALKLGREAREQEQSLGGVAEPDLLGTYTTKSGETLRDVATAFYGAPDNWTKIADANGFTGSIVPAGTLLQIPKVA